jgi:MFS family permease
MGAITGTAFTIPAAFQMIVRLFPDPKEQRFAMAVFGGAGALANGSLLLFTTLPYAVLKHPFLVAGLVIGGIFTQLASWHGIFWTIAIIAITIAIASTLYIRDL